MNIEYLKAWYDLRVRRRYAAEWPPPEAPEPATATEARGSGIGCVATLALQVVVITAGYVVARDSDYARQVWTGLWVAGLTVGVVIGLASGWISSRRGVTP